tara:strand:+ start:17273 stop:18022 length:750 start_codon:yes stop_codon:yes gene_type:complete
LLYNFAYRDYRARYAQTLLGYGWAIIQPIMAAAVLFFLFRNLLKVDTQGVAFLSFTFSGLLFWNYFAFVLSQSAASLISAQSMLQKIYFPRIILPLSKGLLGLVEMSITLVLFLFIAFADAQVEALGLLSFFPLLISVLAAAWGLGLWLSALSIRYRDLQQALPFLLQMLFFISPIAYSPALVQERLPESLQALYYLNPISGILELFRAALFNLEYHPQAWLSILIAFLLFISGWWYFHRVERKIADLI